MRSPVSDLGLFEARSAGLTANEAEGSMKLCAIVLLFSTVAFGACVNGYPTVQKEYTSSTLVLIGKMVGERKTPGSTDGYFLNGDTYKVVPTHVFKGKAKGSIELFSENSSGRFPMQLNQGYLLFAYADHGRLIVDNCGKSDLISRAQKTAREVARLSGGQ